MRAHDPFLEDRLAGTLLGTALGDALGLAAEGLAARVVARRFGALDRFRLLGRTGYVSDDTEQTALVAEVLVRERHDPERIVRLFRRSLLSWFARLPFGIGFGTLRACVRIALGLRRTGVASAGNGAAMRAAVIGVVFREQDRDDGRRAIGAALARVTHTDPRAVAGALFVADVAAGCARVRGEATAAQLGEIVAAARAKVDDRDVGRSVDAAVELAGRQEGLEVAGPELGTTGFVVHTVGLTTFCLLRFGLTPMEAIRAAIRAGGDTDTHAAIVGAWVGALRGTGWLPEEHVARLHDGPFGPTHLRGLALALASNGVAPRWSWLGALLRNLALYPVVLAHGFRGLVPW